ncbi:MAG: carbohydrate ABC transporter permease [Lachnospiraceae bacterium]
MKATDRKKNKMTLQRRRSLEGLMFVSPWIVGAILFFIYPLFVSLRLSVSDMVTLKGFVMEWAGFKHYKQILFVDTTYVPKFIAAIKDTLINTPITLVFSLFIAILINQKIRARGFFRTTFFIPVLLGSGYVMNQLLGIGIGNVVSNQMDNMLTGSLMNSLGPTFSTIVADVLGRITVILWKSGVQIILFLSGLQGIPGSLYEAAKCDGATAWENFWKITLPIISPIIMLNFIYTMIDSFTDSNNAVLSQIISNFNGARFNEGAAMGWVYFAFTFLICGIAMLIMKRCVYNIGER